jgi:hypothetical protein
MTNITAARLAPIVQRVLDRLGLGLYKKHNTIGNAGRSALLLLADGLVEELIVDDCETHPNRSDPLLVWCNGETPEQKMIWLLARAARRFEETTASTIGLHTVLRASKDPGFDGEGLNAASAFIEVLWSRRQALKEFIDDGRAEGSDRDQ